MSSPSTVLALLLMLSGSPHPLNVSTSLAEHVHHGVLTPEALWEAWPSARFVTTPAPCLDHATLVERIAELEARHRGRLSVEEVGRSVEGRAIHLLTLGRGPRRMLLWSRMHGDEPSATPALLDIAHFLLSSRDPEAAALLDGATLLLVPMLNPDGAERYTRTNAQAIDINRDALRLATPEGRLLKALRDRFEPELGFNLHDQDRRTTVGETGRLATVALLAVAGDAEGTMTPGRARAKRVCAAIARSLERFVPGGIARYDEDWNPRAFGDNITAWGTPVVLIESGGLPSGWSYTDLTRLHFVALLSALSGLVRDDLAQEDPDFYERLDRNHGGARVDVLVSGGTVWQPGAGPPYRADVAFNRLDADPVVAGCDGAALPGSSSMLELGDAHLLSAGRTVDATGRLIVPALAASIRGLAARQWLDEQVLGAIGRLAVARVRWHVAPPDRASARAWASDLRGPGLPAIEVVEAESASCLLEMDGPPTSPESAHLDAALDALTRGRWRSRVAGRPLAEVLGALTSCSPVELAVPSIAPDGPASLILLQPRPRVPPASGPASVAAPPLNESWQADELSVDVVFIDGREPPPAKR